MTTGAPLQIELRREELAHLGRRVPGPHAAGAPFGDADGDLPAGSRERLEEMGVLAPGGGLAAAPARAIGVLATSVAWARLEISGGAETVEYDVWFDTAGRGAPVSVVPTADRLLLADPAATDEMLALAGQLMGDSLVCGGSLEAHLAPPEALVLAALLDAGRREMLRAFAERRLPALGPFDDAAVRAAVADAAGGPLWLTGLVVEVCGAPAALPEAELAAALDGLIAGGHLLRTAAGHELGEPAISVATRLLTIDKVVAVAAARDHGAGAVGRVGFTCVQGGALDLLTVERVGDLILLESVSAATVMAYADALLRAPLDDDAPSPPPPAAAFHPTHIVPADGLAAFERPDPSAAPVARLDPRLEVAVDARQDDWAHVVCSNGWDAWVDGRRLERR